MPFETQHRLTDDLTAAFFDAMLYGDARALDAIDRSIRPDLVTYSSSAELTALGCEDSSTGARNKRLVRDGLSEASPFHSREPSRQTSVDFAPLRCVAT